MSPLRRHGGGRPRTANSILELAERWRISERTARRLAALHLTEEAMAVMAADSHRCSARQRRKGCGQGSPTEQMRARGMHSRTPVDIA